MGLAAGAGLGALLLHLRDPHVQGSWGLCPFHAVTGLDCPGCGGLRAVHDLTNGQVAAAAGSNLLLVALLPVVVVGWLFWVRRRWTSNAPLLDRRRTQLLTTTMIVVAVGFAVLRNTPWGQGLAAS